MPSLDEVAVAMQKPAKTRRAGVEWSSVSIADPDACIMRRRHPDTARS